METLEGFPSLPALWLRQAKPAFANADRATRVPVLAERLRTSRRVRSRPPAPSLTSARLVLGRGASHEVSFAASSNTCPKRVVHRHALSDSQWTRLQKVLPSQTAERPPRPASVDRRLADVTGLAWGSPDQRARGQFDTGPASPPALSSRLCRRQIVCVHAHESPPKSSFKRRSTALRSGGWTPPVLREFVEPSGAVHFGGSPS
jgi:hypothetical protein